MLYATARSVREEKSKQRNALQDFSRVLVSLVQGKGGWRIGSVEVIANDFFLAESKEARGSVVLLYKFLRRFIKGEVASPELFGFSEEMLEHLRGEVKEREILELYAQVKILHNLGYVSEAKEYNENWRTLDLKALNKLDLEQIIKDAVASSHL